MASITYKKNFSIGRVVAKLVATTLALYVGNTIINVLGSVMANTSGPFNMGFKLIGWTVETNDQTNGTAGCLVGCGQTVIDGCEGAAMTGTPNCITSYTGTGVLAVIGLVGLASIVMEFVEIKMQ